MAWYCLSHSALGLWAILLLLVSAGAHAQAPAYNAEQQLLSIDGLSIHCPFFRQHDQESCEISVGGTNLLVKCAELLDHLLPQLVNADQAAALPSPLELRNYLLQGEPGEERARSAFELLKKTAEGLRMVKADAGEFLSKYPGPITALVLEGKAPPDLMQNLWMLSDRTGLAAGARLRTALALRSPQRGLIDLFSDLEIANLDRDRQVLQVMEQALREQGNDWADVMEKTQQLLPQCSTIELRELGPGCSTELLSGLAQPAAQYLQRVRVHRALDLIKKEHLRPEEVLQIIADVPYQSSRTPETHQLLLGALHQLAQMKDYGRWVKVFTPRHLAMLAEFSRHDWEIALVLSDLLEKLQPVLQAEQLARLEQIVAQSGVRKAPRFSAKQLQIFSALFLMFCLSAAMLLKKRAEQKHVRVGRNQEYSVLNSEERAELRELRRYFGLSPEASAAELVRIYHKKARGIHPDTAQGSSEEFALLHENYQRAKELLSRMQRISPWD